MDQNRDPSSTDRGTQFSRYAGTARLPSGRAMLWSGLTGFVGVVPGEVADCLEREDFAHIPEEVLRRLHSGGLFFQKGEDEGEALVDVLETLAKQGSHPTHYRLILTGQCDLACSYCMQAKLRKQLESRLSPSALRNAVKYVEHNSFPGDVEILLMGGEPLYDVDVAIDAIDGLCREFASNGIIRPTFKFITNGLNLSSFISRVESPAQRIRNIQVTLDQDKEMHDSAKKDRSGNPTFERVVDGVKRAVDVGCHITLRMNIHDPDWETEFLQTCERIYEEIGVDRLTVYPALVIDRRKRDIAVASSSFSRLIVAFFLWHHSKTGDIHPHHMPPPRWINCHPKLGPPSMIGPKGEVYSCTYSKPKSPSVDAALENCREGLPLNWDRCSKLAQEVWNETCRGCKFLAFCTGVCSIQSAAGQTFTADCESWAERFRTYGELLEKE